MKRNTQSGSALIQLLVIFTVIAVFLFAGFSLLLPSIKQATGRVTKSALFSHMRSFRQCIYDGLSWEATVNASGIACLQNNTPCTAGAGGRRPLQVMGSPFTSNDTPGLNYCIPNYDSDSPTAGFTIDGSACNAFNEAAGNDSCPYKIEFFWEAECLDGAGACVQPRERIISVIRFRPATSNIQPLRLSEQPKVAGFPGAYETYEFRRGSNADFVPIVIQETKTAGNFGGPCAPGGDRQRQLNKIKVDPLGLAALAGGGFRLQPGVYDCTFSVPGYLTGSHKARLIQVGGPQIMGSNAYSPDLIGFVQTRSSGAGRFVLNAPTDFRLVQTCESQATATDNRDYAMGVPKGDGEEIYSYVNCRAHNPKR